MNRWAMLLVGLLTLVSASVAPAGLVVPVSRITSNSAINIAGQLGVSIDQTNVAAQQVRFVISNGGPVSANIVEIYWDDTAGLISNLTTLPSATTSGVGFQSSKVAPGDLPSGNNVGFTADFAVDEGKDNNQIDPGTGVTSGAMAAFKFDIPAPHDYTDVEAALAAGLLRIGMHVRSINGETGDSFVTAAVPEPSAFALLGVIAAATLVWQRIRTRVCRSEP